MEAFEIAGCFGLLLNIADNLERLERLTAAGLRDNTEVCPSVNVVEPLIAGAKPGIFTELTSQTIGSRSIAAIGLAPRQPAARRTAGFSRSKPGRTASTLPH